MKVSQSREEGVSDQLIIGDINDKGRNGDTSKSNMMSIWPNNGIVQNASVRHKDGCNMGWLEGHADFRKPTEMNGSTAAKWMDGEARLYYWIAYPN